jgi:putative membrane protein
MIRFDQSGSCSSAAALPPAQWAMLGLLLVAVVLANVDQPYPELAPLQHVPTVLLALTAPLLLRRWPLSTGSVASIWLFLLLHTLGGRYIYSYVPYDDWSRALTGQTLSDLVGWSRNHYDRFIHFAFGLLWTLPVREALVRRHGVTPSLGLFMGFAFVALIGALYEIFEWALTIAVAADMADSYNGQQGDPWDPQKDMAMAQIGSVAAILWAKVKRA